MKLSCSTDDLLGRVVIEVAPQGQDGVPPVRRLWVDGRNRWEHAGRSGLACILLLDRFIGEICALQPPCDLPTAAALRRFLEPRAVQVVATPAAPLPSPEGARTATVGRARHGGAGYSIRLAPDTQLRSTIGMDQAVLASNLRTLLRPDQNEAILELALAVLFAGNLFIGTIMAAAADFPDFGPHRRDALAAVLGQVGIALVFVDAPDRKDGP